MLSSCIPISSYTKSSRASFEAADQCEMINPNAVALVVMLLAVRDAEIRDGVMAADPHIFGPVGDEVDGKPGVAIRSLIDNLVGVFSGKDTLARSDVAKKLARLIGKEEANQLMASFPDHYRGVPEAQKNLLQIEVERINRTRLHIEGLRDSDLRSIANDLPANEGTPLADAVEWILKASNSKNANNAVDFSSEIERYVQGDQDLTDRHVVNEIHACLVPQMKMDTRHIVVCAPTLSSASGEKLFQIHLQRLRAEPVDAEDLGEHLFAGIVGYHPYPDGNGRVARAVYAIDKLRKQAFRRLSIEREDALSGLPPKNVMTAKLFSPLVRLQ